MRGRRLRIIAALFIAGFIGVDVEAQSLVQQTSGGVKTLSGSATTLSLDFGSNIGAGHLVAVLATSWIDNTSGTLLSCAITGETTPTEIHQADVPGSGSEAGTFIFYVVNTTGGSKAVTLTSGNAAADTYIAAIALEFSGIATASAVDGSATNNNATIGGSTTITTTALTPSQSGDVFLAVLEETNGATLTDTSGSGGGSWTESFKNPGGGQGGMAIYKISTDSSAQTGTATFTSDGDNRWAAIIVAFKSAGGGGTPHPVAVADASRASEVPSRVYGALRRANDAVISGSDKSVRVYGALRQPFEAGILTDNLARLMAALRAISDATIASDKSSRSYGTQRTANDATLGANELASRIYGSVRQPVEGGNFNEALVRSATLSRAIYEANLQNDFNAGIRAILRSISDTTGLAIGESSTRAFGGFRSLVDAGFTGDISTRSFSGSRSMVDGNPLVEYAIRGFAFTRSSAEVFAGAVGPSGQFALAYESLFAVGDTSVRANTLGRAPVENLNLNEAPTLQRNRVRFITENTTPAESAARIWSHVRVVADQQIIAELSTRSFTGSRSLAEAFAAFDVPLRASSNTRSYADAFIVNEVRSAGTGATRSASDYNIAMVFENGTRSYGTPRQNYESGAPTEFANRLQALARNPAEVGPKSEVGIRIITLIRTSNDQFIVPEFRTRQYSRNAFIFEGMVPGEVVNRLVSNFRSFFDADLNGADAGRGVAIPPVVAAGPILSLGSVSAGSGYTNGVYTAVPLTGGNGASASATITVSGNAVTSVALSSSGNLYHVGDVLTGDFGGGAGFQVPVTQIGPLPQVGRQFAFVMPPFINYFRLGGNAIAPAYYADTFTRADSLSLGSSWTTVQIQDGQQQILSNTLTVGGINMGGNSWSAFAVYTSTLQPAQYAQMEIKQVNIDQGSATWYGPAVRLSVDQSNQAGGYVLHLIPACVPCSSNQMRPELDLINFGAGYATVASFPVVTVSDHDLFRIEVNGDAFLVRHNGQVLIPSCNPFGPSTCGGNYAHEGTFSTGKVGMGGIQAGQGTEPMQFYKWSGGEL
jgi:hypothetical protein